MDPEKPPPEVAERLAHFYPALHPLLLGAFGVAGLAAANAHQGLRPSDVVVPLGAIFLVIFAAWLVSGYLTADRDRRGLLTLIVALAFGGYGIVASILPAPGVRASTAVLATGLAIVAALGAAGFAVVLRSRRELSVTSRFLTVMGALLLIWPAVRLAPLFITPVGGGTPVPAAGDNGHGNGGADAEYRPDIYLIVLDAYTGRASLDSIYGHDNGPFEDALRERGFFVPRSSRPNYVSTYLALATMLNWEYLDGLGIPIDPGSSDRGPVYRALERNRTVRELKRLGYEYIHFRSSYPPLSSNRWADVHIPDRMSGEFRSYWLRTTVVYPTTILACRAFGCAGRRWPFIPDDVARVEARLEALAELAPRPGPKFVFAHFLLPHAPFRFRSDCRPREPYWPRYQRGGEDRDMRVLYVAQVECLNRRILTLVDRIIAASSRPPIVLLQSDHGYSRLPLGLVPPIDRVEPGQVSERADIFAAYYLPADGASDLYDTITPVNVFRIIMSRFLGTDVPTLPDETFWSAWDAPYRVTRIGR